MCKNTNDLRKLWMERTGGKTTIPVLGREPLDHEMIMNYQSEEVVGTLNLKFEVKEMTREQELQVSRIINDLIRDVGRMCDP